MGQIYHRDFTAGWCPDDDYQNGRPNGQLRMDNLCIDESGAIILTRTSTQINTVLSGQTVISCYSKYLNGKLYRFYQLASYSIWVDADQSGGFKTLITGGSGAGPRPAAYGAGFGNIFISNGKYNQRFDGTNVLHWGTITGVPEPTISQVTDAVCVHWYGPDGGRFVTTSTLQAGSNLRTFYGGCTFNTGPSNSGILRITTIGPNDFTNFVNSSDVGAPTDQFCICVNTPNSSYLPITQLEVRAYTNATSYFYFDWGTARFTDNFNYWYLLTCARQDFKKSGSPDWTNIAYTEARFTTSSPIDVTVTQPWEFYNDNDASANIKTGLDGSSPFTYVQQYLTTFEGTSGKTTISPPSRPIFGKWSSVSILPYNLGDPKAYEVDILKTGGELAGNYYFIGSQPIPMPAAPNNVVIDSQSALETQASAEINNSAVWLADIPQGIRMIEGPINGRMVLMTDSSVYFTDTMNPEVIDDRMTIQPSNSADETCLFITKASNSTLILATTQDFYEISGTLAELDGGVFDIYNRPAGIKQPAVSPAFCVYSNVFFYVAAGSIRQYGFSVTEPISKQINLPFHGLDRYGVLGLTIGAFDTDTTGLRWALAYTRYRLYVKATHRDNTTSLFMYDVITQTWYRRLDDVVCMYVEESGEIMLGRNQGYLGLDDKSYTEDIIHWNPNQTINYQSICNPTQTPLQRKDLFTLKVWAATGGGAVNIYLLDENGSQAFIGTASSSGTVPQQFFFRVHGCAIDLSQRFGLIINGATPYFKMTNWTLDYDERPPREMFIYIPNNNFGTPSKKRVRTLPMVIDTFSQPVLYTAIVDLQQQNQTTILNTNGKQTVYHLFETDAFGVDYGGTLEAQTAQPFEFYGLMNPVSVEELPPPKLLDQVGPYALDKKGKIYGFRVRMVSFTTSIHYKIIADDVVINEGDFATKPGVDTTYEVLRVPPGLLGNVIRIEFTSPDETKPFMRWYVQLRYVQWGMGTDEKWATIAGKVGPTE